MRININPFLSIQLPYCNTHCPKPGFTAVKDTPENMRLKQNTTNQSSVVYHKDHMQEKSKFTAVADDPETVRNRQMQQQASSTAYKGTAPPGSREANGNVAKVADNASS